MGNVCQNYAKKIEANLDSLLLIYEKKPLDLELSFEDQANPTDKSNNEMKVIVSKKADDEFICPKCGEKIHLNTEKIDDILLSNVDIIDNIIGLKLIIDNILKNSSIKLAYAQLKNMSLILKSINEEIQKNNEKLKNLINYKNSINTKIDSEEQIQINNFQNKNVIKGELEIDSKDINADINLFKSDYNYEIDLYINDKKAKLIKDNSNWKIDYNFINEGKYPFIMVFNDTVTNMEEFFGKSTNIVSLDLSNFDSSNITSMRILFNKCKNLKEIKGLDKLITNNVRDMEGMFQYCVELEYLDLSNFDTSKVENMAFMFNHCERVKEIKGINKFITNNVTSVEGMFQSCFCMEYICLMNVVN